MSILSSPRTPGLIWLAAALIATVASLSEPASVILAVAGALCALALPQPGPVRSAAALAMAPIAIAGAPAWAFVLAGGLLLAVSARSVPARTPQLEGIQRHLEWCRRRDDAAHLLWVHAPDASPSDITAAMSIFRVTDNAALLHEAEGNEIVAMVDDLSFSRDGLAQRLRAHLGDGAGIGWAHFPADGVTLDALFGHARTAAVASTVEASTEISPQLRVPVRRIGLRTAARAARMPAQSSNQG
jgi:hypothetical protein